MAIDSNKRARLAEEALAAVGRGDYGINQHVLAGLISHTRALNSTLCEAQVAVVSRHSFALASDSAKSLFLRPG